MPYVEIPYDRATEKHVLYYLGIHSDITIHIVMQSPPFITKKTVYLCAHFQVGVVSFYT